MLPPRRSGPLKRLLIAESHGFCSGVARAIKTAEQTLAAATGDIYCLHEIVHNEQVVNALAAKGMKFVDSIDPVPENSTLLFSAHGISPAVRAAAEARHLHCIDATCPFVERIHLTVRNAALEGKRAICIGHRGHDEVTGICGEAQEITVVESVAEAERLGSEYNDAILVSQTTMDERKVAEIRAVLRKKFPRLTLPPASEICCATAQRQEAVRKLAKAAPVVLVLGSKNSSNTLRLAETAAAEGAKAILASSLEEVRKAATALDTTLGITSGASTPEDFLEQTIKILVDEFGFSPPEDGNGINGGER